ncbi:MAG: hypothetical protein U0797_04940 [Gemmataceae bacterium]
MLIELLVVIAIIAILIGLLLLKPSRRCGGGRSACAPEQPQAARPRVFHNHHDAVGTFPMSRQTPDGKAEVRLSAYSGHKPVVQIFRNFT